MPCSDPMYDSIAAVILFAAIGSIGWFIYKVKTSSFKKKEVELEELT